jgi:hypothetical protein
VSLAWRGMVGMAWEAFQKDGVYRYGIEFGDLHFPMSFEESAVYLNGRNHPLTHDALYRLQIERGIEGHGSIYHEVTGALSQPPRKETKQLF